MDAYPATPARPLRPAGTSRRRIGPFALIVVLAGGCTAAESREAEPSVAELLATESSDYCALPPTASELIVDRPGADEEPIA